MQPQEKRLQMQKESFLRKKETLFTRKATAQQKKPLRKLIFLLPSIQSLNTSRQQLN